MADKKKIRKSGGGVEGAEAGDAVITGTYANAMTDFMFKRLFGNRSKRLVR